MASQVNSIRHFKALNSYSSTTVKKLRRKSASKLILQGQHHLLPKPKTPQKRKSQVILLMNINA